MYSRMRRSRRSTVQQRDLFGMQVTEEEKTDDDEVPEEEEEEDEDESETGKSRLCFIQLRLMFDIQLFIHSLAQLTLFC